MSEAQRVTGELLSRALVAAVGGKGIVLLSDGAPGFTAQFPTGTVLDVHATATLGAPPDGLSVWEGTLTYAEPCLVDVVREALDGVSGPSKNSGAFTVEVVFRGRFRRASVPELLYVARWSEDVTYPWRRS